MQAVCSEPLYDTETYIVVRRSSGSLASWFDLFAIFNGATWLVVLAGFALYMIVGFGIAQVERRGFARGLPIAPLDVGERNATMAAAIGRLQFMNRMLRLQLGQSASLPFWSKSGRFGCSPRRRSHHLLSRQFDVSRLRLPPMYHSPLHLHIGHHYGHRARQPQSALRGQRTRRRHQPKALSARQRERF